MDEKLLNILRSHADKFTSAEHLSRKLSISQATVARQIHKLQDEGYDIQTQPHLGYKLVSLPDRLLAEELTWQLNTKIVGRRILSYNTVDSTNSVAFSLAEQGVSEGTAVVAEEQTKGRGRLGRDWISPKSKGIYLSLILRPKISPQKPALITLMAAVSCAETIRCVCGLPALIRWPNDILVHHKKVCGILTEMQAQDNKVKFIILGIGINVNPQVSKLPQGASSLQEEAKKAKAGYCRLELARELLRQLDREYIHFKDKGSSRLITQWKSLSAFSGKHVKVILAQRTIEGCAQDIDRDGALIVRLDNGFREHVVAGEVVKVR